MYSVLAGFRNPAKMATLIHTLIFERSLTQPDSTAIVDLSLPLECQIFSYQHLLKQIDKTVVRILQSMLYK